jgi:2Fe-2S ferredoxin
MPKLIIESITRPALEVSVPEGGSLADVCDAHTADVPFSCRGASCGTCRVDVLEGAELLEAPKDEELDVLDIFGDDATKRRLACQSHMRAGGGTVRVRAVNDA